MSSKVLKLSCILQCGISITADKCINLLLFLAQRAVVGWIGMVIRDIFSLENRIYREKSNAVYPAENSCNTTDDSTIIQDTFDCFGQSGTGGNGTVQNQNIFPFDHWLIIITENKLSGITEFRCDHVNGLVCIHGENTGFGQLF